MQEIYKVYVNGRLVKLFDDEEESIQYARGFSDLIDEFDVVYVIREQSDVILEIRKEKSYVE